MPKNIKDVFKKVDEMKNTKEMFENEGTDFTAGYEQALEDVKPVIEKGVKVILEGLKGEEMYKNKKFDIGNPDEYAQYKFGNGSNKRESKLREDIEDIMG